jgi:serpin B
MANSVWCHSDYVINQAYEENMARIFYAEINGRDFDDPSTLDFINGWCNEKSHGMIPSVIDKFDRRCTFQLINALYYSGQWKKPFKAADTYDSLFKGTKGESSVAMMHTEKAVYYLESDFA